MTKSDRLDLGLSNRRAARRPPSPCGTVTNVGEDFAFALEGVERGS